IDLRPVPSQQADVKDEITKGKKEMLAGEGTGGIANGDERTGSSFVRATEEGCRMRDINRSRTAIIPDRKPVESFPMFGTNQRRSFLPLQQKVDRKDTAETPAVGDGETFGLLMEQPTEFLQSL